MKTKKLIRWIIIVIFLLICCLSCYSANKYVSKTGRDSNPGTLKSPFLTMSKAVKTAVLGDTIIVRSGIYREYMIIPKGVPVLSYDYETATVNYIELNDKIDVGINMKTDDHNRTIVREIYYNKTMSDTARKNNCGKLKGTVVVYTVMGKKHSSTESQETANYKALYDVITNKQEFVNKFGKCVKK